MLRKETKHFRCCSLGKDVSLNWGASCNQKANLYAQQLKLILFWVGLISILISFKYHVYDWGFVIDVHKVYSMHMLKWG